MYVQSSLTSLVWSDIKTGKDNEFVYQLMAFGGVDIPYILKHPLHYRDIKLHFTKSPLFQSQSHRLLGLPLRA